MQAKEWRFDDKASWGPGPWQEEPDKMQWTDEATGLPCLIVRNRAGALCGYVGVPDGHPWFEKHYDDVPDAEVHGGLTFAEFCEPSKKREDGGICHIVEPGEDDRVWWLGFDCSHGYDVMPAYAANSARVLGCSNIFNEGEYRTVEYVRWEIARLARQATMAKCSTGDVQEDNE